MVIDADIPQRILLLIDHVDHGGRLAMAVAAASIAGGQRFELEETYLGAEAGNVFTLEGGWRQLHQRGDSGPAVVFRLDPDGADQWFELQPDGSLELLDAQGEPRPDAIGHRLQRI